MDGSQLEKQEKIIAEILVIFQNNNLTTEEALDLDDVLKRRILKNSIISNPLS
ncbi:hypothetical protein [Companilactobacillus nantensis]|uniref:Uncharacterized protein n=1 Tax=Companilactobacillus nantensis DSM 16982 TaxID=1423774 RepID=A0A0R1WQI2_9LACO|nr:hypothetical protein [Companilactobacillus nantensis]KRM18436.1 hypothetical protein FD31_GL000983 [Companilactobacillus nantensis DSM 16982]GEO63006.1 hypothetical protein LNA01_01890 [Companilactobacillus nantensis]